MYTRISRAVFLPSKISGLCTTVLAPRIPVAASGGTKLEIGVVYLMIIKKYGNIMRYFVN